MPDFNFNDTINFARKLTPARAWNGIKVFSSYMLSSLTGRPIQWGYPVSVSFEPTTSCNLRCPECPSGLRAFTRPTGMLKKDFFSETIDQLAKDLYSQLLSCESRSRRSVYEFSLSIAIRRIYREHASLCLSNSHHQAETKRQGHIGRAIAGPSAH